MSGGERKKVLVLIAACLAFALTFSLGIWQMRRAAFKENLAAQIQEKNQVKALDNTALAAMNFGAKSDHVQGILHRQAQLKGRWLHAHTVFLDNRPMQIGSQQRVGFYVVTPLLLDGLQQVVWVQRGWVARDFQDRQKLPALPQSETLVTIKARVIDQISRAYEMSGAKNNLTAAPQSQRIWQNLPVLDLGVAQLPFALLQTSAEGDMGASSEMLMRNWPAPNLGLDKHLGYAFQWFALSALIVFLYVWFQIVRPRRKNQQDSQQGNQQS